jgi:hypothetical protein
VTTDSKLLGICLLVVSACSDDPPTPSPPCEDPGPAFVVVVRPDAGSLPEDTVLRVTYGAGQEDHDIGRGSTEGEVVFCQPAQRDGTPLSVPSEGGAASIAAAGAGGAEVVGAGGAPGAPIPTFPAARCELYTEGSASVDLLTAAYPPLHEDLEAEVDECGPRTVGVELELTAGPETD